MKHKFAKPVVKKLLLSPDLARTIALNVFEQSLPQMDLLQLCQAMLFHVLYFCTAFFKEAQSLRTENIKVSPQGSIEIIFCEEKTNQFKDSFLLPSLEA